MLTCRIHAKEDLRIEESELPEAGPGQVLIRLGAGVTRVKPGDKIAVSPSHACGRCDYCREGREQLCRNMRFLGSASIYPHVQGMFSEYFVMGERQCYPVAADVSLGEIAFAEPLAVALHAVNRGPQLLGKSVLITGVSTRWPAGTWPGHRAMSGTLRPPS